MRKSKILNGLLKSVGTFHASSHENGTWVLNARITDPQLIKALRKAVIDAQSK